LAIEIFRRIESWDPDILLINKGELISPDVVRALKSKHQRLFVALFFGDQRGFCERSIARLGSVCDVLLINNADIVQVEGYLRLGCPRVETWHTASDPDIYRPVALRENLMCDVAFMGGNYTSFPDSMLRAKLMVQIAKKAKLRVYGGNWPVTVPSFPKVYEGDFAAACASAKIVLGINAYNDIHQYTSNRTWNVLSCGTAAYLTYRFEGMADLFKPGEHLYQFKDINAAIKLVEKILDPSNEASRKVVAGSGRKLILAGHTYRHRAEQLLGVWKRWQKPNEERIRKGIGPYEERRGSKRFV